MLHKADTKKNKKGGKAVTIKNEEQLSLTFFVPYEVNEGDKRISAGSYYNLQILSDRWYDISFWKEIDLAEI